MTDHFREKSIVFRDTRDSQEYDAKNRLSIPSPSSLEPVAEVESVKKKLTLTIFLHVIYLNNRYITRSASAGPIRNAENLESLLAIGLLGYETS